MRVRIDQERCQGHGRCYALAPEVFAADDDGFAEVVTDPVPPGLEERTRLAARNCPEEAVVVEG
ncbi:ferredoxin [Acidimicrobiaceae bacterium USS-CC1]|uniref:Ferredoxin n=1 Tax=Acidiferrimicrobium australe TaxID=2664430 RepID=A0ABW9QXK6_9ACTN|nr:ferredoxin [Acidiferrimicrobium australe]